MDFGRRAITAMRLQSAYSDGPTATSLVAGNAVLHFWEHLHFCARSSRLPSLGALPISTTTVGFCAGIPFPKCGKFLGNLNHYFSVVGYPYRFLQFLLCHLSFCLLDPAPFLIAGVYSGRPQGFILGYSFYEFLC